ncbi:MAG: transposase family protein [Bacteroidales bacterium]
MKDINFALSGKSLSKFIKTIYNFKSITLLEVSLIYGTIIIEAKSRKKQATCPVCGRISKHKRVTYIRTLYILPLGKYPAILHLHVSKYECKNTKCTKHIFSEQLEGVTTKYARHTKSVVKRKI